MSIKTKKTIDINCDLGESYGRFRVGNDQAIFPYLTSCNIACGYHGGDPLTIVQTIELALTHGVVIGAHPSYPDLQGFGRRPMSLSNPDLLAQIQYQIGGLMTLCAIRGAAVRYVKPHGALYTSCVQSEETCRCVLQAIQEIDPELILLGLAGSRMEDMAKAMRVPFAAEGFIDRRYTPSGQLQSRSEPGAVISDSEQAARQAVGLAVDGRVETTSETWRSIDVDSLCIHGDSPNSLQMVVAVDQALEQAGVEKKSFVK